MQVEVRHVVMMLVFFIGTLLVQATPAQARQCVWNKAGFVLRVDWYDPSDLGNIDLEEVRRGLSADDLPPVVQRDVFPVAQGKCQTSDRILVAALYCEACEYADIGISGIAVAISAIVSLVAKDSTLWSVSLTAWEEVVGALSGALPDYNLFWAGAPPTDHWMDVWGTAFDPQVGDGGTAWFDNNDTQTCDPCVPGQ